MKHSLTVLLFTCLYLISLPISATEVDKEKGTTVAHKTDELSKIIAKAPKISGYLQTGWNYTTAGSGSSSFQAKRLRLITDGTVTPKLAFRLQIEAFNGIAGSTNGNGQKNIQVMDAFATYTFNSAFKIRAGQYYIPLGYENYDISPATLETVDFSNICYRIVCRNPYEYNFVDYGRDLGIMVMGDLFPSQEGFNHLSYNLSLTNGSIPSKDDSNKSKDIITAVTLRPLKYWNIKASYGWGEYTHMPNQSESKYNEMNRMIIGTWYNNPKGFDFRTEYGFLKGNNDSFDERGAYVLLGYHILTKSGEFLPTIRYDKYEDMVNETSPNNYDRILAALTFQPKTNFKLQLNYQHGFYSSEASEVIGKEGFDQIQLMGIFKF
ncbi:MAG: porin [Bacteroidia bacterium]|nr:porin [Bacteroidia bacterium]